MCFMAGEGRTPSVEVVRDQVERLVASPLLSHSESLCKLLRYLADHAAEGQVKEYQIATEVFHRPSDFDPRLDSTVRVQTGRLRSKLAEYYAGQGIHDPWVIEVPKGAYALNLRERVAEPAPPAPTMNGAVAVPAAPDSPLFSRAATVTIGVLAAIVIGLVIALAVVVREEQAVAAKPAASAQEALLRRFWSNFTGRADPPVVVFSNAEFVGRPETGMKYFDGKRDDRAQILDHYTGVGEVTAIHELDQVFFQLGQRLRVKRGRLLTFDDAKQNDLIFVGSPSENLSLRELPNLQEFVFRRIESAERRGGDLNIVNLRPQPGEARRFLATANIPLTEDYSVIGYFPGIGAGRWELILAGITTIGTQAAVEYVCRPKQLEQLFQRLGAQNGQAPPPAFEAVIRVKVSAGVPVNTELVALHKRGN